jgi:hypothetical protein
MCMSYRVPHAIHGVEFYPPPPHHPRRRMGNRKRGSRGRQKAEAEDTALPGRVWGLLLLRATPRHAVTAPRACWHGALRAARHFQCTCGLRSAPPVSQPAAPPPLHRPAQPRPRTPTTDRHSHWALGTPTPTPTPPAHCPRRSRWGGAQPQTAGHARSRVAFLGEEKNGRLRARALGCL